MFKNNKVVLAGLIIASLLITATACGKKPEPTVAKVDETVTVTTAKAHIGDINAVAVLTGKITAQQEVNIVPKMAGKVAEIPVEVGSIVKKGQVVLKLDADEVRAQIKQAEAGYAASKADYYKMKTGAREEQRNQTKASLQQAVANYQKNLNDLKRMKELYNEGAIAESALEGQKVQFSVAEASYLSAKESWNMIQKGETAETLKVYEARMEQQAAVLDLQKANSKNSTISSPIDGIVGARNVDPGEIASSAVPSLTIINIDTVQVETNVTEGQVNKLSVGQEVDVKVAAASANTVKGIIKSVAPMANPQNKMYLVKVSIENKDHILKPGMFAEIALPVEKKEGVMLVPRAAVTQVNGDTVVYIVNSQNKTEQKKVDTGVTDGVVTEILSGLDEGAVVVTTNLQSLDIGTKVTTQSKL